MTEVKICGLSTIDAIDAAIDAGSDYLGFVIFNQSPRHVDVEKAKALCAHVAGRAKTVVLTVDPDDELLNDVRTKISPDILQLHGHETPDRIAQIKSQSVATQIWKAVPVETHEDVTASSRYLSDNGADLILFDAKPPKGETSRPGGNGQSFEWSILVDHPPALQIQRPYALAGGLTPQNVAAAINEIRPPIVDVSSGVETAPGVKDATLIESFIRATKTAKQSV